MDGGSVGEEDGFLGNGDETLAQSGAVDAVEGNVVDGDGIGAGGDGVEELEQQGDEAGFAATGAAADGDFFAWVNGKVDVVQGEVGLVFFIGAFEGLVG